MHSYAFFFLKHVTNAECKTALENISIQFLTVYYGRLFALPKKVVTEAFDFIRVCAVREKHII
jgi:hypothetical protein